MIEKCRWSKTVDDRKIRMNENCGWSKNADDRKMQMIEKFGWTKNAVERIILLYHEINSNTRYYSYFCVIIWTII
jgi:hypothetical protein